MRGRPFPIDISDMLDHILFLVQEEASRSRIIEVSCALSVLEEAGQVASEDKISDSSLWKQAINSRLCEIEQDGCTVSKAPPLSVATLIIPGTFHFRPRQPFVLQGNRMGNLALRLGVHEAL